VTDKRRVRLGLTNVVSVACKNGGYHICFTEKRELVTCPACKETYEQKFREAFPDLPFIS
jgi:hypothetical protein